MMDLVVRIGIEIVFVLVLNFSAMGFWQSVATRRVFSKSLADQDFLDRVISALNDEKPFTERARDLRMLQGGWANNLAAVLQVQTESLSRARSLHLIIALAVLIGSYFLGIVYLCINVGIFFLLGLFGRTRSSVRIAYRDTVALAVILYRWRHENPKEHASFMESGWTLRELNGAVERHAT
jgi:hypothetical protein